MANRIKAKITMPDPECGWVDAKDHFDARWELLSLAGWCDDLGGVEYQRVLREWLALEVHPDVTEFIKHRANIGPNGE